MSEPSSTSRSIGFLASPVVPYDFPHKAESYIGVQIENGGVLYSVRMPCGEVLNIGPGTVIPDKDVPCPCGDKLHWLWKVETH